MACDSWEFGFVEKSTVTSVTEPEPEYTKTGRWDYDPELDVAPATVGDLPPSTFRIDIDDTRDSVATRTQVVNDLVAQCVRIGHEMDILDTKLTVLYGQYRDAMTAEFIPSELTVLRLGITRESVMLDPDGCTDKYFEFTYHDYDGVHESTRLPVAWLRDPEAFVVAKRSELPEKRADNRSKQLADARRQLALAQQQVDRLTAQAASGDEL